MMTTTTTMKMQLWIPMPLWDFESCLCSLLRIPSKIEDDGRPTDVNNSTYVRDSGPDHYRVGVGREASGTREVVKVPYADICTVGTT